MTEQELIAKRLAGMSYANLGKLSGMPESKVWKLLEGKVPGKGGRTREVLKPTSPASKSHSELAARDDARAKAERKVFGHIWAGARALEAAWRSWRYVTDVSTRDAKGRLKASVVAELDRQADRTDQRIAQKGQARPTSDMTDLAYAESPASYHGDNKPRRP